MYSKYFMKGIFIVKSQNFLIKTACIIVCSLAASNAIAATLHGPVPEALLNFGNVPVINTTNGDTTASVLLHNVGNRDATLTSTSFSAPGITLIPAATTPCGRILAANTACNIGFKIESEYISGGASAFTQNYTGGSVESSVSATIHWYSTGGAVLGVRYNKTVDYNIAHPHSETITVIGDGALPITITSVIPSVTGSDTTATLTNDNCSSQTLAKGQECKFTYTLDSSAPSSGNFRMDIGGYYYVAGAQHPYTRLAVGTYTATNPAAE